MMRLKYMFEIMDFDDYLIAVPVDNDVEYRGVVKLKNETAAFIFDLLKNDITESSILDAIEQEYDVSRDEIVDDVSRYIQELQQKGLLIE